MTMWMQIIETMYAQQVMLNKINTLIELPVNIRKWKSKASKIL